jgi:hypothetical protein
LSDKPNIVYFHVDNLGYGELACYGGGILRGAETRRIDQFARERIREHKRDFQLESGVTQVLRRGFMLTLRDVPRS